ncbi:hypothetical protein cypCar_00043094 [Cyprinus carpio]|nr:hypothetical protein cypCar_00043094 [Cyprinus carpio]
MTREWRGDLRRSERKAVAVRFSEFWDRDAFVRSFSGVGLVHLAVTAQLLQQCEVRDKGCHYLASALRSNPSHLRELYLSYNYSRQSGVKMLSNLLNDPNYALNKLECIPK